MRKPIIIQCASSNPVLCYKSPSYSDGSTGLSGIFIHDEYVLAVKNIVALYKGEKLASNSRRNNDNLEAMEICTKSSVHFPLELKKTGIIITGAPGIGKHNHMGYIIISLTPSRQIFFEI